MLSGAAKATQPMFPCPKRRGGASKIFQKGTMVMEKEQGQGTDKKGPVAILAKKHSGNHCEE